MFPHNPLKINNKEAAIFHCNNVSTSCNPMHNLIHISRTSYALRSKLDVKHSLLNDAYDTQLIVA